MMPTTQVQLPEKNSQAGSQSTIHPEIDSRVLKINGDQDDPWRVWPTRVVVFLICLTIFLLKLALPQTFITFTNQIAFQGTEASRNCNPTGIDPNKKIYCLNFTSSNPKTSLLVRDLAPAHQFVVFYLCFTIPKAQINQAILDQQISIQAHRVAEVPNPTTNQVELFTDRLVYNQATQYKYVFKDHHGEESKTENENENQNDDQNQERIYQFPFAYDRVTIFETVQTDNLLVIVQFSNFNQVANMKAEIKGLAINPAFTTFSIVVRGVFCGISIIVAIFYIRRFCQLLDKNRILEIRLVTFACLMLIFFNDPWYAATVLRVNPVSTFLSSFHSINLFILLLGLWMFFLRRIYYESNSNETVLFKLRSSWQFYIILFVLYAFIATLFLQFAYYAYQKTPILLPSDFIQMKAIPIIVIVGLLLAAVAIYQLVMFILIIYSQCCREATMRQRHRNYLAFFPFFFIMFLIFFAFGGAMPYSYEGAWILYGYSFMNIFVYVLAYLYYTPTREIEKQNSEPIPKDNGQRAPDPSFSQQLNNQVVSDQ